VDGLDGLDGLKECPLRNKQYKSDFRNSKSIRQKLKIRGVFFGATVMSQIWGKHWKIHTYQKFILNKGKLRKMVSKV